MKSSSILLALFSLSVLVFSCKKETDAKVETAAQVQNKWMIDSVVTTQKLNGTTTVTSLLGESDDYIEFGSDGQMRTKFQGTTDVSTYTVKDEKTLSIGGDAAYILELTNSKFVLYTSASAGSLGLIEIKYYLRR